MKKKAKVINIDDHREHVRMIPDIMFVQNLIQNIRQQYGDDMLRQVLKMNGFKQEKERKAS